MTIGEWAAKWGLTRDRAYQVAREAGVILKKGGSQQVVIQGEVYYKPPSETVLTPKQIETMDQIKANKRKYNKKEKS